MLRRLPTRLKTPDGVPITRLFFSVDEASVADMASPDAGKPSREIVEARYTGTGRADAAWRAFGSIDDTYGRLEISLDSDTGPWTTISGGGSLADATGEGDEGTAWFRYVAHRWGTTANPDAAFSAGLYYEGAGALDED